MGEKAVGSALSHRTSVTSVTLYVKNFKHFIGERLFVTLAKRYVYFGKSNIITNIKFSYRIYKYYIIYKNKVHFVDTLSRRTYFWDTAVPCGSENSHNVVQLNLLTPYPTLMQSLKEFSPESIRAIARNPNIQNAN